MNVPRPRPGWWGALVDAVAIVALSVLAYLHVLPRDALIPAIVAICSGRARELVERTRRRPDGGPQSERGEPRDPPRPPPLGGSGFLTVVAFLVLLPWLFYDRMRG